MINRHEVGRRKSAPTENGPFSGHFAVVLSLVFSLTIIAIISKNYVVNSLWIDVAAFAAPLPVFLYFENRIVRFGVFTCIATIVLPLGAAVLFGI
jgi:hypothetical protein